MQRAFANSHHLTASPRSTSILIAALVACLMLALSVPARAQESTPATGASPEATPAATPAGATPTAATDQLGTVLMQHQFDQMPNAPMTVRLLRITLEPGAAVPMHNHPGIEFDLVEAGTLTARTDGTMTVNVDGAESETSDPQTLSAGSWAMYPTGTGMSFANEGEEPVVILSAVILSVGADTDSTITYTEGDPTDDDFEGVSFVVLGDGLIQQFPEGGATVIIDQLVVPAGQPVPAYSGVAMLSKASGTFAFAAGEGAVQVTRTATPQLQPNAIPGQEFTLADNDAAFFPAGYASIDRPDSADDLALIRLLIDPAGELTDAPATVAAFQPETATTETQPTGDGLGVGAIVAISEDGVNVRAEATTESDIVDSFPAGTQFELIGGPVEGEDYTWYQVRGVGDLADVEGWLVTDFMDVIEPAGELATGDQTVTDILAGITEPSTPAAETAPGEIGVGATVVSNVENLRLRPEPSTEGEAITALEIGTELEIIGGPEEAEDFTWYEVEVVADGTTGWVASEFIELPEE
jgi:quercetin dioxygenase-like cupin family protein